MAIECRSCKYMVSKKPSAYASVQNRCQRFPAYQIKELTDWCGEYIEDKEKEEREKKKLEEEAAKAAKKKKEAAEKKLAQAKEALAKTQRELLMLEKGIIPTKGKKGKVPSVNVDDIAEVLPPKDPGNERSGMLEFD